METAATKNSEKIGSGIPAGQSKGTTPADIQVSQFGNKKVAARKVKIFGPFGTHRKEADAFAKQTGGKVTQWGNDVCVEYAAVI